MVALTIPKRQVPQIKVNTIVPKPLYLPKMGGDAHIEYILSFMKFETEVSRLLAIEDLKSLHYENGYLMTDCGEWCFADSKTAIEWIYQQFDDGEDEWIGGYELPIFEVALKNFPDIIAKIKAILLEQENYEIELKASGNKRTIWNFQSRIGEVISNVHFRKIADALIAKYGLNQIINDFLSCDYKPKEVIIRGKTIYFYNCY